LPGPVYSDASQAITVEVGGYFTLSLRVVKRLGVSWFVSYDKSALMMVINDLYVDDNPSSPGLGGTEYYRFQALKAGNTRVDCALEHGPTGPVSERRTFNVRVK
jgi:predicted secreted protein